MARWPFSTECLVRRRWALIAAKIDVEETGLTPLLAVEVVVVWSDGVFVLIVVAECRGWIHRVARIVTGGKDQFDLLRAMRATSTFRALVVGQGGESFVSVILIACGVSLLAGQKIAREYVGPLGLSLPNTSEE
jgi:hypothetical protein